MRSACSALKARLRAPEVPQPKSLPGRGGGWGARRRPTATTIGGELGTFPVAKVQGGMAWSRSAGQRCAKPDEVRPLRLVLKGIWLGLQCGLGFSLS